MKILVIILFLLINSHNLFANPQICSWIMDEPFKEYQEEAKDQHAAFYVVVSDGECEYGMTIGENSEEKANKASTSTFPFHSGDGYYRCFSFTY